jgi:molecular chaperone DnaK
VAYRMGVDLGTTYTAAALNVDGRVEMLSLGNRATQVASVLYLKEDGTVLVGETAEYRGAADPTRLTREFKRRIGGVVPIIIGGSPYSPQSLLARVLSWTVEAATQQQGGPPEQVCVTYPANWGPFKQEILEQVLKLAGLKGATTCTEPEAAAIAYASRDRVPAGAKLAVYDLGGGTFDAAVLVREGPGFRLVGTPDGVEHLGGIDFDAAICQHVLDQLGPAVQQLDESDPATLLGLHRLRRDCVTAKETLSSDDDTVIPVALPGIAAAVPITRAEFEEMVRPAIGETVSAMQRALGSAGVTPDELHAIVMVGGSSRIPLVGRELTAAFGRPLALDNHPKHDVAIGAAIRAAGEPAGAAGIPAAASGFVAAPVAGPEQAAATPRSAPPRGSDSWPPPAQGQPGWGPPAATGVPVAAGWSGGGGTSAPAPPDPHRPDPYHPAYGADPHGPVPAAAAGWSGDGGGGVPPRPERPDAYGQHPYGQPAYGQPAYGPGQYGHDPRAQGAPNRGAGPAGSGSRRWVVIGAIGVVALLAVVLGILVVLPRSDNPDITPTVGPTPGPTTTPTDDQALPASAQPLPDDVIVWPQQRTDGWDITTITSAGVSGPPLVASPQEDTVPLVSPDRRTVFYLHATSPGVREVRVVGADGSGDRPLFDPVPDGCGNVTRPAFGVQPQPQLVLPCIDPDTGDVTLKLVSPDGTVVRDLARGWISDPSLTPDGRFALYWGDDATRGEGGAIYQVPTDGSGPPVQVTEGGGTRDNDAAVSPKGDRVAITRAGEGIWTVGIDTGPGHELRQLTKEASDQDPSWSPDASQLVFKRRDQMWVMNADGSGAKRISEVGQIGTAPAWSPR